MVCKICLNKKNNLLFRKEDFNLYRCPACGMVYSDKDYSREILQEVYSESYYKNLRHFSPITDKRYASILKRLSKYSTGRRLLDIGCGAGQFLLAAKRSGWDVLGTEISEATAKWMRINFSLDIRCQELLTMNLQRNYFDCVTMFESIEHLNSPDNYLKKINHILKKGGILFVTTPNFNSLSRMFLGKNWSVFSREHLFYFSTKSLLRLLRINGFRIVNCLTKNFSILELKDVYLNKKMEGQSPLRVEGLRRRIESSPFLNLSKGVVNTALGLFQLGDSIWVFARKISEIN